MSGVRTSWVLLPAELVRAGGGSGGVVVLEVLVLRPLGLLFLVGGASVAGGDSVRATALLRDVEGTVVGDVSVVVDLDCELDDEGGSL